MEQALKRYDQALEDATVSEEMAMKVLKEFCGSYKYALVDILLYIHGMDDPGDLEEDEVEEIASNLANAVDAVLNAEVEKEILGAIPKN